MSRGFPSKSDATGEYPKISTEHDLKLRTLLSEEAETLESQRRAERSAEAVLEGTWDPSKHPRGAFPQNRGWWSPTGGSGAGSGAPPGVALTTPARATPSAASANSLADENSDDLASPFHLIGDGAMDPGVNTFRLSSASSKDHAIGQAAAKGDLTTLKDLISSGGLSAGERKAAQAAINRQTSTAQNIISNELKGGVTREFPREMLKMKLKDIMDIAKGTGPLAGKAKKALKLLRDNRFKK